MSEDTIYRQDAIKAVSEACFELRGVFGRCKDAIEALPSAQPTEASCWGCNCPKMERLKEQKTFSEMVHLHDAETHGVCLDTISRQAAIDAVADYIHNVDRVIGTGHLSADDCKDAATSVLADLPSAQPEPIRINLNEPIKVKLTDWAKEIYYHQYDKTNQITGREICKPEFPKEDENGYTEFQLWRFMELYGEHMGMTQQNVIEPLEMVYER